jgi:hypothetical protein
MDNEYISPNKNNKNAINKTKNNFQKSNASKDGEEFIFQSKKINKKSYLILLGYLLVIYIGIAIPDILFKLFTGHWIYHTNRTLPFPLHILIDGISPTIEDPQNSKTLADYFMYLIMFISAAATFIGYHKFATKKLEELSKTK